MTEKKSGPAFGKVARSQLLAVMRRNSEKARDYALRHGVPHWYDTVDGLLSNPYINAVYIASPPSSHRAIAAGKNVYLEKPMAMDHHEARMIVEALK